MNEHANTRLALIPLLAEKDPAGHIGRTTLMKYMYFLQTLRNVPLGYNFSMYSYGPFDSDVLSDLSTAESRGFVSSTPVSFSGGYGYRIVSKPGADGIKREAQNFIDSYREDVDWVVKEFGNLNSAEMELASTIVFVDRELEDSGSPNARAELVTLVNEIKPHFGVPRVERTVDSLRRKGVLVTKF